ncbi:MAG: TolC family protein, partial [Sphingobacteriales bacterium]
MLFCLLLALSGRVAAQPLLTLEEAVKIALQNNYEIKLAENNTEIAGNNVSLGNAGFLPSADATFNDNNNLNNIKQTRADGTVQEQNGVRNTNIGYGVGLNWTIFNGFGMFARYEQLKELRKRGEADFQFTVLSKISDVTSTYYDLVQQQQQLRAYDTVIAISRQRVETAQVRFEIGKAARLEVLNAQVDFNTDTTNLLRQKQLYNNTQTR